MENTENDGAHQSILSRDFFLAFCVLFTFITALYALVPTLPLYLETLGSNISEIGVIIGVYGAASLVCRFIAGGVLIKYSEKTVMIAGAVFSIISFLASLILRPFWPFFAIRFLQGAAMAFLDTAVLAFIVSITPTTYRGQGMAYILLAPSLAMVIAPVSAMWFIGRYSFTAFFLSCAALALFALFFACALDTKRIERTQEKVSMKSELHLLPRLMIPGATTFMQNFIYGGLSAFVTLYAIQHNVPNPGLFFSASALTMIVGRMFGGRILDKVSKEKVILLFMLTAGIDMIILSFTRTLPMFILTGAIWGLGAAFFYPASMAYSLEFAGSSSGTVLGILRATMDFGLAVGPMITGLIVPFTGYSKMFLCLSLVALANLCYFQFYVRRKRSEI